MTPRTKNLLASALIILGVGGLAWGVARYAPPAARHAEATTYYCPMHPSYTSDRPGDCPICNMRLVAREPDEGRAAPEAGTADGARTTPEARKMANLCYLHNCPKVHEGRPCPMLVVAKEGEEVTCPICGTHIVEAAEPPRARKILYWTDPMIPGYRSDTPGTSPMGMDLVPVYEESGGTAEAVVEGYAPVLLSPRKQQLIGVTTAPAERRPLVKTIRTAGRIAYDPELYLAEQEYVEALRAADTARQAMPEVRAQSKRLLEAARMRLRLLGLSGELIEELGAQGVPDPSLLLTEPAGRAWLYAPVYEFELPWVAVGQTITAELPSAGGARFTGVIRAMDPVLDPATRTARVRAVLNDPEGRLKPELFVNATITTELGERLAVPDEAVFNTGLRRIVFVDQGQGLFEPREVVVGAEAEGFTEIRQGVAEGEPVVTSGNFLIDSESRLKAAIGAAGAREHQHGQ